jgi:signal transduction histidine kinase
MAPQLRTEGERAHGAFPFAAGPSLRGCLHVTIPRPLFEGGEVVFLRFVASLSGLVLASAPDASPIPPKAQPGGPAGAEPEVDARRYVAMAVHDLRNPLNVISGYGSLLADGTLGPLSPEQSEAVDAINRQLTVLLGHIGQLIDFDRLSRAETSLSPSVVPLRALFDELRERCFASTSSAVSWPGAEAGFEFVTDRRRLFAVVQNLVDNALKHGGAGAIDVTCTRRDGRLEIAVRDHGPGLPAAVRQALADRDACERLRDRGTGLGLFTVACYVKALGGRIDARTPDDGGTTLAISLPSLATPDRSQA